jgi:hypothetical protein
MNKKLSNDWLTEIKAIYAHGCPPGEDLRYDDIFTQLKNQNAAVSPDAAWMLDKSSLLLKKSADMRVCIYALHAASILGDAESLTHIFSLYAYFICEKFDESFPTGDRQKISTFEWCVNSYLVKLMKTHSMKFKPIHIDQIKSALNQIHDALEQRLGEAIKWHNLVSWLDEQTPLATSAPEKPVVIKEVSSEVPSTREAKPFFDKFVRALLKEEQYEKAVGLARVHRWSNLTVPVHKDHKTELVIRQAAIDKIKQSFERQDWKMVIHESEDLFMEPQSHFYLAINYWSFHALIKLGETTAAELILQHVKILYKNYGQMFSLMYNGGQLFCESETLAWIELHAQDKQEASLNQNDAIQSVKVMDVENMKTWLKTDSIKTKKDVFIRDLMHLKLSKTDRKDISLVCASQALLERSIDEKLYAWEPELAQLVWAFHAGLLKEEKQQAQQNNNSKTLWQAQWDRFTSILARAHLPAALEIMKYI